MTWIRTVLPSEGGPELKRIYETLYAMYPPEYHTNVAAVTRPDGTSDSVVAAHSLIPDAMHHMMAGLAVLLRPDLPLTRRQQEMIATVTSALNRCFY
ncbi:MAG TPA: hypothetical protein VMS17_25800 [Gemmataceae bacterium]|nr:hypothetical protein [Gemmataceae bacterium]